MRPISTQLSIAASKFKSKPAARDRKGAIIRDAWGYTAPEHAEAASILSYGVVFLGAAAWPGEAA